MLGYLGYAFHLSTGKAAGFVSYPAMAMLGFLMEDYRVS